MLQFEHVYKAYNAQPVLMIPSLKLEQGIYLLQGINGSGKTTLLRILAGEMSFKGEISLNGHYLRQNLRLYKRSVNCAVARPMYPAAITGFELVKFYQDMRGAAVIQTDMLICVFKMHHFISLPIETYSTGVLKKLSLLLAFIGKPALVLLDEPFAMMDETTIRITLEMIYAYYKEFKTSFILSSHQTFILNSLVINKLLIADQSLQFIA